LKKNDSIFDKKRKKENNVAKALVEAQEKGQDSLSIINNIRQKRKSKKDDDDDDTPTKKKQNHLTVVEHQIKRKARWKKIYELAAKVDGSQQENSVSLSSPTSSLYSPIPSDYQQ